jgi:hypothetical protein
MFSGGSPCPVTESTKTATPTAGSCVTSKSSHASTRAGNERFVACRRHPATSIALGAQAGSHRPSSIPGLFPRMAHGRGGPRRRLKTCRGRTCRAIRSATSRAQPVCDAYSTWTQGPSIRPSMPGHSNKARRRARTAFGQVEGKCSNQEECTAVPAAKTGTRPANHAATAASAANSATSRGAAAHANR